MSSDQEIGGCNIVKRQGRASSNASVAMMRTCLTASYVAAGTRRNLATWAASGDRCRDHHFLLDSFRL